jgi:hypothetical protein
MNPKAVGVAAAGLGLAAFIGFCIYYDQKRRSATDTKPNLKQKTKKRVVYGQTIPGDSFLFYF